MNISNTFVIIIIRFLLLNLVFGLNVPYCEKCDGIGEQYEGLTFVLLLTYLKYNLA